MAAVLGWGSRHAKLCRQVKAIDVCPPCIQVIHHQLHYELPVQILVMEVRQQEAAGACSKDGDVITVYELLQTQRFIEPCRDRTVLTGKKRPDQF